MAGFDLSALLTYVDEQKFDLITRSFLGGKTISNITKQDGCKGDTQINLIDGSSTFQANSCSFNPLGSTTFTQRLLKIGDIKEDDQYCVKDLNDYYTEKFVNPGSYSSDIGIEETLAELKANNAADYLENLAWKGDSTAGAGDLDLTDGYLAIMTNDANVVDETSLDFTASNIIAKIDAVIAAVDSDILNANDLILYMGNDTFSTYRIALIDANLYHPDYTKDNDFEMRIHRALTIKVIGTHGLTGEASVVLSPKSNMFMGVDLDDEESSFEFWEDKGNRVIKFLSNFKAGFQYARSEYVVLGR